MHRLNEILLAKVYYFPSFWGYMYPQNKVHKSEVYHQSISELKTTIYLYIQLPWR